MPANVHSLKHNTLPPPPSTEMNFSTPMLFCLLLLPTWYCAMNCFWQMSLGLDFGEGLQLGTTVTGSDLGIGWGLELALDPMELQQTWDQDWDWGWEASWAPLVRALMTSPRVSPSNTPSF